MASALAAASVDRESGGHVPDKNTPSSSSSSSPPSSSCGGSALLLYGAQASTFGWRDGLAPGDFAKQLRVAVLHITGLPSLDRVELWLEEDSTTALQASNPPQRVTPRDLFQGNVSVSSGGTRDCEWSRQALVIQRCRLRPKARLQCIPLRIVLPLSGSCRHLRHSRRRNHYQSHSLTQRRIHSHRSGLWQNTRNLGAASCSSCS